MTYDVRKSGIPALAYPHYDAASPVSLSFIIKCNDRREQITFCLQASLPLQGLDNEQTVILQYDADNMVPGAITLGPATIPLPQQRLNTLARAGNPQIRTLSIRLGRECPVWCLPSTPLTPRPGCEDAFKQLANLAQATQISILFDYNWLHRGLHSSLQRLLEHPKELSGFPVGQRYREQRLRQVNWTVFNTADNHAFAGAAAAIEEGELPPDYAEVSNKRPRHASTPAPPSPPPKRVLLSPYEGVHASPTEKGSTATPSPKHPYSATTAPKFSPLATLSPILAHIQSAKEGTPLKPASLAVPESDLQLAVDQAVSTLLPNIVDSLLPSLLPRLLVASSPTPSSQHSIASQLSQPAPPPQLTSLGITLHDRLASKLESEMSGIYAHTLSHANWLRSTADDKFAEMLDEERLALERVAEERYEECKEKCEGVEEDVVERLGWRAEDVCEGAVARLKEEMRVLERKREEVTRESEELRREKEDLRIDREDLRMDRQDLRKEKEALRKEREDLRKERETLRRVKRQLEDEKRQAEEATQTAESCDKADSAPV